MENQQMLFQEFEALNEVTPDQVTVSQLDQLVARLKQAREFYDLKSKEKNEANARCEEIENLIMGTLDKIGRKSYPAEGIGTVTRAARLVYQVPKTNEDKEKLFQYIETKYGEEVLTSMVSIHSQKLTAWANTEAREAGMGQIPGLEAPTSVEYLQFKGAK